MMEQAIWKILSEGGMKALTIERLALETEQNVFDLRQLYPEPAFMVLVLINALHRQAMTIDCEASLSTQDCLTDMVMNHFDVSLIHRETIRSLWADLMKMPTVLMTLRPYLMKIVEAILKKCGMPQDDFWAPVRLRAYFAFLLYIFYVWLYDDSSQQEQTLVSLDKGLKQLENLPW